MTARSVKHLGVLAEMPGREATDLAIAAQSRTLVYLVHGVTGTPAEMYAVARGLSRYGCDVYATTLPGHCTRLRDLLRADDRDWLAHVRAQLAFARDRYQRLFVAGLSGGGLVLLEASTSIRLNGVGVLSPTLIYDGWNTPWTHVLLPIAMRLAPWPLTHVLFHVDGPPYGIKDEEIQARMREAYSLSSILRRAVREWWSRRRGGAAGQGARATSAASKGYPIVPLKTFIDMDRLIRRVRTRLPEVTAPTVVLQAREDDVTSPRNAYLVYEGIASPRKRIVLLSDCYHVITVDRQRRAVVDALAEFFGLEPPQDGIAAQASHALSGAGANGTSQRGRNGIPPPGSRAHAPDRLLARRAPRDRGCGDSRARR